MAKSNQNNCSGLGGKYCKMSLDILARKDLSPTAKLVHAVLRDFANNKGLAWPATDTIARMVGRSERMVQTALRELEKINAIELAERRRTGRVWFVNKSENISQETQPIAKLKRNQLRRETQPVAEQNATNCGSNLYIGNNLNEPTLGTNTIGDKSPKVCELKSENCSTENSKTTCSPVTKKSKNSYSDEFEKIWQAYPNRAGKFEAFQKFKKLKRGGSLPEAAKLAEIIEQNKARNPAWQPNWAGDTFVPHFKTWLNQRRWEDELPAQGNQPQQNSPQALTAADRLAAFRKRQEQTNEKQLLVSEAENVF